MTGSRRIPTLRVRHAPPDRGSLETVVVAPPRDTPLERPRPGVADPTRALAVLRAAQRALVHATTEEELLGLICAIAVNEAGYHLAWAGLAEDDERQSIRPIAWAGVDTAYLDSIRVEWADTPLGRGPAGRAIRDNRPVLGNDFAADADLVPWRDQARMHGLASSIALPLRMATVPFGVLAIYATEIDAFSTADIELLGGIAEDLAFGISTLRARTEIETGLRHSQRSLADAQRISHIGSWEWDLRTGVATRSDELHRIYGVEPGSIPPTTEAFLAFVHPDDRSRVQAAERAATDADSKYALEYRGVRPDGSIRIIRDEAEVIRDDAGTPVRMVGTVQDITDQVDAAGDRATLAAAVEQTADAVWIKSIDGIVQYVNRAFTRVYGYEPAEIVGQFAGIVDSGHHTRPFFDAIWEQVKAGRTWTGTIVNRRQDGREVEVEAVISGIVDPSSGILSFMQTDRDVTREHALEKALVRRARERSVIEAAISKIDASSTPEAIAEAACAELIQLPLADAAFVIALDDEDRGRVLAVEGLATSVFASQRTLPRARAHYLFGRASDGVWTEEWRVRPEDGAYGQEIAATGVRTVAYAPLRGSTGIIGVVGLAISSGDREPFIEQLPILTALASILGQLLAPAMEARYSQDSARARTQGILDGAAFRPFFQPIVDLHSGAVVGYEALSRFADGVPPDITFALAARCGLGIELEVATLAAAVAASDALPAMAYLSVNASPAMVSSGAATQLLAGVAREVVVEITEHEPIEDYPSLLEELALLGPRVRVAVDDAGAGYASLRHILELAPAYVKLDIGLIRGINADPARQALIAGMGYFALKRKLRLIAEGIETEAELKTLKNLGVPYGQGYLLGRPQDGRDTRTWKAEIDMPSLASIRPVIAGTSLARA